MEDRNANSVSLLIRSTQSLDRTKPGAGPVRTLGIDLGTTNSTVAEFSWLGAGNPIALADLRCLEINQPTDVGEYTGSLVPSVVALVNGANGGLRVGEGAKRLRARTVELGLEQGRNIFWMLDACRLLARWSLPEPSGALRFQEVLEDEQEMRRLFEEFVRGFYLLEQSEYRVAASPLRWGWEPLDEVSRALLPGMRTDVLLSRGDERIVIDTKYTPRAVTEESGYYGGTFQSGHLYQMHAYLSTLAAEGAHPLRGILLYPRVDREVRAAYRHLDYGLEVRTIDLGAPWRQIHQELLRLTGMPAIATQRPAMTPTDLKPEGVELPYKLKPALGAKNNFIAAFQMVNEGISKRVANGRKRQEWTTEEFAMAMTLLPEVLDGLVREVRKLQDAKR